MNEHRDESSEPDAAQVGAAFEAGNQADSGYRRPDGVAGSFQPPAAELAHTPPPPVVSPAEQATFGRPPGQPSFAPLAGERIPPRPGVVSPPVAPGSSETFGRTGSGGNGFDPAPGTRMPPQGRPAESPWWKQDAAADPWRDPRSASWLGRPAVLAAGRLEQLDPDLDVEQEEPTAGPEAEEDPAEDAPKPRVRIGRFGLSALLLSLVIALVAGAVGGGVGYLIAGTTHDALHNSDLSLAKTGTPANRPPGSIADIIKRVSPAVVSIDIQVAGGEGVGSGIVIDKAGYILTNNHVVAPADGGGGMIVVTFSDQSSASATIVGRDPQTDLAVIKVQVSTLTVASLGDSGTLAVGDPVIAIGSPLGLMNSASSGIVSALNRPISPPSDNTSDPSAYINAIQTDAAVNPGNSGGALVDASGAVVGVNFALENPAASTGGGQAGSVGLGFSIPMNTARPIAEQLIKTGKVVHASIGLTGIDATDGAARHGAYVSQITPGGPADKAGIKAGDVITVADSTLVSSFAGLMVIVQGHQPGDVVKVRYYPQNKGNPVDVSVTLGSG